MIHDAKVSIPLSPILHMVYIVCSNNQMEIQESETMYDTRNPQWASAFDFEVYGDNMVSNIHVNISQ